MSNKSKSLGGLRSIFGKLRRSNSGNLEDLPLDGSEFRRGGIRATAGPRLGWNNVQITDTRYNELIDFFLQKQVNSSKKRHTIRATSIQFLNSKNLKKMGEKMRCLSYIF